MSHTYLALGDSYTIGEQVPAEENFPHQLVALLNKANIPTSDPVIIAVTGWTTDELLSAIMERNMQGTFSFVTLLIGVNNQYRGRAVKNYQEEFENLLNIAIQFAHHNSSQVFVLSIPDWGVTPFASGKDAAVIAQEIDAYNEACEEIAVKKGAHFLYITDSTRAHGTQGGYLAPDGLHPSGREYALWAQRLLPLVRAQLAKK